MMYFRNDLDHKNLQCNSSLWRGRESVVVLRNNLTRRYLNNQSWQGVYHLEGRKASKSALTETKGAFD